MSISKENAMAIASSLSHREYFPSYCLVFWKGNTASNNRDADRTDIEVFAGAFGPAKLSFTRDEGSRLETTRRMLDLAFAAGESASKKQIRDLIGVKDQRS
jgi:hypothetical protein